LKIKDMDQILLHGKMEVEQLGQRSLVQFPLRNNNPVLFQLMVAC